MTIDFEEWLESEYIETEREKDDLITAVRESRTVGRFNVSRRGAQLAIRGQGDSPLVLVSEKARRTFLKLIEALRVDDPDNDPDEGFRRNMENPHA